MGDGLIVAVLQFQPVPHRHAVTQVPKAQVITGGVRPRRFGGGHFLHHLKQTVIQGVLRQQTVKFLTGQFLVNDGKRRVKKPDCLIVKGQQFILLHPQVHRGPHGQPVLFRRCRGRVHLVIGGFQRCGQGAGELGKYGLAPLRQVGVLPDNSLHGLPHHG